ncbi:kinase-like domain-containing protein [Leptodontidium sp. MPI-SDFR-AT-0119]|nr:kinase-like domain-containing protein [Leptodontidium sp. MPI-SDFR-AT-0119]
MAGIGNRHLESYLRTQVLQLFTVRDPRGGTHTLRFIAEHTSIPVPKVYHAFTHRGKTYILMERIRGETTAKRWRLLSETSKASIFIQLKQMIEELRSIPSDSMTVSNLEGGPIQDCRLPQSSSWGPFKSVYDFQLALRNNVMLTRSCCYFGCTKLIEFHESVLRPLVFTHGDLSSFNILLRDDQVYTMAWHANPQNLFWQKEVHRFLDPYEEELRMEKLRRTYFGEI